MLLWNFSLQEFLLEDISEEIDTCLFSRDEADINETNLEFSETNETAFSTTNISEEGKLKQMKDDLLFDFRAELKNMMAVSRIDTNANNGISYKKHIEVLQEQLHYSTLSLRKSQSHWN